MNPNSQRKRGFTLIELLVVITIIGILATVAIGPMGDLIFGASKDASGTSLKEMFKKLQTESDNTQVKWPGKETIGSAQGFAPWFVKKTSMDDAGIWFLPNDPSIEALEEDDKVIPDKILNKEGDSESEWGDDSPWEGEGGHVLFSDGKVKWYETTKDEDGDTEGVFKKWRKRGDDEDDSFTANIQDAIPDGWEVLKPEG